MRTDTMAERETKTDGFRVSRRSVLAVSGAAVAGGLGLASTGALGQSSQMSSRQFTVRIENVSDGDTLQTTAMGDAADQPVPLTPFVWAVHSRDEPIFDTKEAEWDNGLEELAEDGSPGKLANYLANRDTVVESGLAAIPEGADGPGPLTPGHAYEFSFEVMGGKPDLYLSFVSMFIPSNDLFYAIGGPDGLRLFGPGNSPTSGNVTDHVSLWDTGTEINEEPGVGENQPQRQRGAGVGLVERDTVVPIESVNGYHYPATEDVLDVMITPNRSRLDGSTTGFRSLSLVQSTAHTDTPRYINRMIKPQT